MKTETTLPAPVHLELQSDGVHSGGVGNLIRDNTGNVLCEMSHVCGPQFNPRTYEKAALIVKAVNHHAELVAFLQDAITEKGAMAERSHAYALKRLAAINEQARALLARVNA